MEKKNITKKKYKLSKYIKKKQNNEKIGKNETTKK
jgi:hypothetical protein